MSTFTASDKILCIDVAYSGHYNRDARECVSYVHVSNIATELLMLDCFIY